MIDRIFGQLLNMTVTASVVIVAVLLVRLVLKRVPKIFSYALWAVVLFRLLCPVGIESSISPLPQIEPLIQVDAASNDLQTTITSPSDHLPMIEMEEVREDRFYAKFESNALPTVTVNSPITTDSTSIHHRITWLRIVEILWGSGVAVMLIYGVLSYVGLRRRLIGSVRTDDHLYIADSMDSPFVLGIIRPKIYLPSSLSEHEREYILLHERHHIRRGDHVIRLIAFLALCLHWFNPLVWIAFILSGKDMEMSCDEAVLRNLGWEIRADYSSSLLRLATGRQIVAGMPLAFGEGNTEGRIKNIAKWKKPAIWVSVIVLIFCILVAFCLMTDPVKHDTQLFGAEYRIDEILYRTSEAYGWEVDDSSSICIAADYTLWKCDSDGEWILVGQMEPCALNQDELMSYTTGDNWLRRNRIGTIVDAYMLQIRESEENVRFYLAFCTKKGDILFGYGEEGVLSLLVRLESSFRGQATTSFLERSLAETVGGDVDSFHEWSNANIPGYVIIGFASDNEEYVDGTQIPAPEKKNMGFAVFYHNQDRSGYRLLQCCIYENAASAESGIYLCADQAILAFEGEPLQEQIYDVILINTDAISRAERVWRYADGSEKKQSESYLNSRQLLLYSWENNEEGCTVWQYFYDKWDKPIEYTETVGEQTETSVLKWVDYLQSPEAMEWDGEKQISIPDFPGVTFTYTPMQVYATVSFDSEEPEQGHTILFDGMPIQNVYFTDLNRDGFAELCATVNYGSGIIDTHIVVVDYKNGEQYTLCERSVNDYALRELNGRLVCYKWAYLNGKISDYGHLAIRDGELILVSDVVQMEPTTAAVSGVFDAYLYLPLDGANYRYERILDNPATLTQGEVLYTFREGEGANAVVWYVYALNEYPDYSVVLVGAGGEHFLYRYSPHKAASPTALMQAKLSGKIVIEDGYATCGQTAWADFYRRSTDGEQISINIVHYTTIGDRSNLDDTYYEVYREDYPSLSEFELTYDGSEYTLRLEDSGVELVRTYRYLRKFEEAIPTVESAHEPQSREIYLLTDDRTASLETFWQSIVSSRMEDSISFAVVYSEKIVR